MLYSSGGLSCCKPAAGVPSPALHGAGQAPRNLDSRDPSEGSSNSKCNGSTTSSQISSRTSRRQGLSPASFLPMVVLALSLAGPLGVLAEDATTEDEDAGGDEGSSSTSVGESALNLVVVVVLVAASGLFSGLTLGLLGLDKIGLEIISNGDEPRMAAFAKVGHGVRGVSSTSTHQQATLVQTLSVTRNSLGQ